jgi:hypothetical protein
MTETEEFLATMRVRITESETALHNGDADPRIAMWSRTEPLTLFGAAMAGRGWGEIGPGGTTSSQSISPGSQRVAVVFAELAVTGRHRAGAPAAATNDPSTHRRPTARLPAQAPGGVLPGLRQLRLPQAADQRRPRPVRVEAAPGQYVRSGRC